MKELFNSARGARPWLGVGCVVLLAVLLSSLSLAEVWDNPMFGGDAGHRLNNASRPLTRLGNRFWLPFLQGHIWIFYLLGLPPAAFRLIPAFYYGLAMTFLGLMSLDANGRKLSGFGFSLLLIVCFAWQHPFGRLGTALYQEVLGVAFLYGLIWAGALRPNPGKWVWMLAAVGMMVRESLWICLLAWTLLNWRRILYERKLRLPVLLLWMLPALWLAWVFLFLMVKGQLSQPGAIWPLMINTDGPRLFSKLSEAGGSVWQALLTTRALVLVAGLVVAGLAVRAGKPGPRPVDDSTGGVLQGFPRFSLLTLALTYGLVLAFDPWEMTYGSSRQAVPLLEHAYVWMIVLFRAADPSPAMWKGVARTALVAGLLVAARPVPRFDREAVDPEVLSCHEDIRQLARPAEGAALPTVCIADEYWQGLRNFVAPTLYMSREFVSPDASALPVSCDIAILRSDASVPVGPGFTQIRTCTVEGVEYNIYRRPGY